MNENTSPSKPRSQRRTLVKWLIIGLSALFLIILAIIVGDFFRECVYLARVPDSSVAVNRVLALPAGETHPSQHHDSIRQTSSTTTAAEPPTDSRTGANATLHYPPLIPDTPELPNHLRTAREQINEEFDRLLDEVADYERHKDDLSIEKAQQALKHIHSANYLVFHNVILSYLGLNFGNSPLIPIPVQRDPALVRPIIERQHQFMTWLIQAILAKDIPPHDWLPYLARPDQDLRVNLWETAQMPGHAIYKSDYYRQYGLELWRQSAYFTMRCGWDGWTKTFENYYDRKSQELKDALRRVNPNEKQ